MLRDLLNAAGVTRQQHPLTVTMQKTVAEEYSELMHYTTAAGLSGIISSGCVWATHAGFLNDAEEMKHFFDVRLFDIAISETRHYAAELATARESARRMEVSGGGGQIAAEAAQHLVDRLRAATLSFNQPHIFSLSAAHDSRVQSSGLLSQWRGYGSNGGYAIVFDTANFEELLRLEVETYRYQHVQWADVHYYGLTAKQPSTEDVAESEEIIRIGLARLIRGGTAEETDGFYQAVTGLSCLYKHWGFAEEQEVRVIAIPEHSEVAKEEATHGNVKCPKPIKTFVRGGLPVPYLELFASASVDTRTHLPIKRVIVGPHRDSALRAGAVERLLASNDYEAQVTRSEIPYIGK